MVFRKPYAFLVKYFRAINFILSIFMTLILSKLNSLHGVLKGVFYGDVSNYSSLKSTYIGFFVYILIFVSIFILALIVILLKRKDKPIVDYLLGIIYNVLLILFLYFVGNLFVTLGNTTIEPTQLKLYSDISLLIMLPMVYFVLKYFLIFIGFNLKKFNFSKDLIELKQEASDNEEVELVFTKNTYKYKRGIRRYIREFRYYVLENKLIIYIILGILAVVGVGTLTGVKVFNSNDVNIKETFTAGTFSFNVLSLYETNYDLNHNLIKNDSKFVVASINVTNNINESSSIDLMRIRLFYGDEYVYASDYYNKYFLDLGVPYDGSSISFGENNNYLFIFKVPNSYKSRKYTLKFYDKNNMEDEELVAGYKELETTAKKLDNKYKTKNSNLSEKLLFDKNVYGDSNILIKSISVDTLYKYQINGLYDFILPKEYNDSLLILEYDLNLDKNSAISSYFTNDKAFFSNFASVSYQINGKTKTITNLDIVECGIDNRVFISFPTKIKSYENFRFVINFRDYEYIYDIKAF